MIYRKHQENITQLEKAIKSIELELRRYISVEDEQRTYIYTKILSHLISSWIEVRVLKLAHEPSTFSNDEVQEILSAHTFRNKWVTALNIAICKAYTIPKSGDISRNLSFTPRQRYLALINIIDEDLHQAYEVRNRIAHGQWKFAFKHDLTGISTELTGKLRQENIVDLQLKLKLFKGLAQTIHDLAVSPSTFERDFDKNYTIIENQKNNIHKRSYEDYKQRMVAKYQRGLNRRQENLVSIPVQPNNANAANYPIGFLSKLCRLFRCLK
ncbi:MAG: hypothetical protein KDJ65_38555 [Anaerolineae bacterium]|nr:hypothetical protein [Anaerolineae bacterium]